MNELQRRAWLALDIGPVWRLRGRAELPPETGDASEVGEALAIGELPEVVEAPRNDEVPLIGEAPVVDKGLPIAEAPPIAEARGIAEARMIAEAPPIAEARGIAEARMIAEAPLAGEGRGIDEAPETARTPERGPARDPSQVATLDWQALREAVAGCRACGLCATRRNTVFGVGNEAADWMFIGEAPGEQEDRRGEPFVGPAGKLLDAMLAALGRSRARDVYIANVLKCRPPGNRDPLPHERAQCEPFLARQIELVAPKLIVALGRPAAHSLLGTDASIASLRGRVHRRRVGEREVPVVVTYHPAYLLRKPEDKAKAWADLVLALRTARAP